MTISQAAGNKSNDKNTFNDDDRNTFDDNDRNTFDDGDRNTFNDNDINTFNDNDRNTFNDDETNTFYDNDRNTFYDDGDRNTDSCPQMWGAEDAAHDTSCLWRTCRQISYRAKIIQEISSYENRVHPFWRLAIPCAPF